MLRGRFCGVQWSVRRWAGHSAHAVSDVEEGMPSHQPLDIVRAKWCREDT